MQTCMRSYKSSKCSLVLKLLVFDGGSKQLARFVFWSQQTSFHSFFIPLKFSIYTALLLFLLFSANYVLYHSTYCHVLFVSSVSGRCAVKDPRHRDQNMTWCALALQALEKPACCRGYATRAVMALSPQPVGAQIFVYPNLSQKPRQRHH